MTISWKITQLDSKTEDGFVTTAHWTCSGVDGEASGAVYATASWSEGEPAVAYEDLTEAQVLAWVWASVDKDATEAAVQAQIDEQKAPKVKKGIPWA